MESFDQLLSPTGSPLQQTRQKNRLSKAYLKLTCCPHLSSVPTQDITQAAGILTHTSTPKASRANISLSSAKMGIYQKSSSGVSDGITEIYINKSFIISERLQRTGFPPVFKSPHLFQPNIFKRFKHTQSWRNQSF